MAILRVLSLFPSFFLACVESRAENYTTTFTKRFSCAGQFCYGNTLVVHASRIKRASGRPPPSLAAPARSVGFVGGRRPRPAAACGVKDPQKQSDPLHCGAHTNNPKKHHNTPQYHIPTTHRSSRTAAATRAAAPAEAPCAAECAQMPLKEQPLSVRFGSVWCVVLCMCPRLDLFDRSSHVSTTRVCVPAGVAGGGCPKVPRLDRPRRLVFYGCSRWVKDDSVHEDQTPTPPPSFLPRRWPGARAAPPPPPRAPRLLIVL